MNYIETIAKAVYDEGQKLRATPSPTNTITENEESMDLYCLYALLVLTTGIRTTNEDVHNAYAAWLTPHDAQAECLVPYAELPLFVQDMDTIYAEAIREVASKL